MAADSRLFEPPTDPLRNERRRRHLWRLVRRPRRPRTRRGHGHERQERVRLLHRPESPAPHLARRGADTARGEQRQTTGHPGLHLGRHHRDRSVRHGLKLGDPHTSNEAPFDRKGRSEPISNAARGRFSVCHRDQPCQDAGRADCRSQGPGGYDGPIIAENVLAGAVSEARCGGYAGGSPPQDRRALSCPSQEPSAKQRTPDQSSDLGFPGWAILGSNQ